MNPKKPVERKAKSAGISLEPELTREARELAGRMGFGSLSNYTRFLLTQELARTKGEKCYKLSEDPGPVSPQYQQPVFEGYTTGYSPR